jgi:hypothetical protein
LVQNRNWLAYAECDVPDGTCQEIAEGYHFAEGISHDAALYYKYIIDVWVSGLNEPITNTLFGSSLTAPTSDGNAWSARFQRLLSGGSLVFKSTIFRELS